MARAGFLETMARADLETLVTGVARRYREGALARMTEADPVWRQALDRTEEELGALYGALCEADVALARWRETVAALHRLWERLEEAPAPGEDEPALPRVLREVA